MRIAIITANIKGIDNPGKPIKQTIDCDFYCFTENNLPFPLPNLNARMVGRYIKTMLHRFLPDYDIYVWIDGTVQITSPNFVEDLIKDMSDFAIPTHHDRDNIYEEIGYITKHIAQQNTYLSTRYQNEPFGAELEFYGKERLPLSEPLYVSRFWARRNTPQINKACEEWWLKIIEFTNFEQTMLTWVIWKFGLKVKKLDYLETVSKYLNIHKHIKTQ